MSNMLPAWRIDSCEGNTFLIETKDGRNFQVEVQCADCAYFLVARIGTMWFDAAIMPRIVQRGYWTAVAQHATAMTAALA